MNKTALSAAFLLSISASLPAFASFADQFFDPEDGMLDGSQWLLNNSFGFMPLPIVITEPATGPGLGVAALFFHEKKAEKEKRLREGDKYKPSTVPPSVSVVVGAGTENGTWIAGGGHLGNWKSDSIRYQGFVGHADAKLSVYDDDNKFDFNIVGDFLLQDIRFRLADSNVFLGAKYIFLKSDSQFDLGVPEFIPPIDIESTSAGLGTIFQYQQVDNHFTPNKGVNIEWEFTDHAKRWGGDNAFRKNILKARWHSQPVQDVVLGLRADAAFTNGDVPFYELPFIQMRGIPVMRYQGQHTALAEVEGRYDFSSRWSGLAFVGSGLAADTVDALADAQSRVAYGVGFRYLAARLLGFRGGVDIAKGPEDTAIYLTFGSAWY